MRKEGLVDIEGELCVCVFGYLFELLCWMIDGKQRKMGVMQKKFGRNREEFETTRD